MHGDKLKYITDACETNRMPTVGENVNEVEHIAQKKVIYARYKEDFRDIPVQMNAIMEGISLTIGCWL